MWEIIWDVFVDALLDSVKMLPFLFGAYLLIEYIEHRASHRIQRLSLIHIEMCIRDSRKSAAALSQGAALLRKRKIFGAEGRGTYNPSG